MLKGSTAFNTLGRVAIRRSTERFIESFRMLLRIRAALGPCVWNFMARCHEKWPCHEMPRNRLGPHLRPYSLAALGYWAGKWRTPPSLRTAPAGMSTGAD